MKLIGTASCFADFGCDPSPGNPNGSWTGSLTSFELTAPNSVEIDGTASSSWFHDPSVCPSHILESALGTKVVLDGVVTGDPSTTAHLEVWICSELLFIP